MAKAKFWGVKMPMLGKIFSNQWPQLLIETGKKLNTNWPEKKRNSKGKDRINEIKTEQQRENLWSQKLYYLRTSIKLVNL